MGRVPINCDMGEGMPHDDALLPLIHWANISCGVHAGDEKTIIHTIHGCMIHEILIGAHPSFPGKHNFGREETHMSIREIYDMVKTQLVYFNQLISSLDAHFHHVKPHGALYNLSARNKSVAAAIAEAVKDQNPELTLVGLSNSYSITEANRVGLNSANECFADRTYHQDGSLSPRKEPGSVIEEELKMLEQVRGIMDAGIVTATNGNQITVRADTICLHGDGRHVIQFAKAIGREWKKLPG
jgi:UPF0271 protein